MTFLYDESLKSLYTSTSSDASFYKMAEKIEAKSLQSSKAIKHRIECRLRKLCQQTKNYDWKRNRNNYAMLLLDMLEKGQLDFPFNKRPDDGPLKTLPSYLRPFNSQSRQNYRPKLQAPANKEEDVVNIASAAVDVLHEHNRSRSILSAVNSSNGFRYDAEIQLGACRERCLELEMQMNAKNDQVAKLEKQILSMKRAHHREVDKYKNEIKSLKGMYTKNLGKIIKRYTQHLQNSKVRETTAIADGGGGQNENNVAGQGGSENQQMLAFLQNFKDRMQFLKDALREQQNVQ